MFSIRIVIAIVFNLFLTLNLSLKVECDECEANNILGFCMDTADKMCCKGTIANNICANRAQVCCFGQYDCNNKYTNPGQTQNMCPNIGIISRSAWRSRSPKTNLKSLAPVGHVFIHHTDDGNTCNNQNDCSVRLRSLQSYHQLNKGWTDIAWNFIIGGDGQVYEGVGWNKEGFHTLNWNRYSLGIAFVGNYNEVEPSVEMLDSLEELIKCGKNKGYIRPDYQLHGHRDALTTTECPGEELYTDISQMPHFVPGPLNLLPN
ncbi:unnamed protein product [Oppiella nova]|uniref:Uncharacterized protein n=1 Tax=Oppiella nova TaxID=334625 RepID=A0A7R9QMG1_9ACAR|nr:unnamed protein product [Oppiella nova]CAG2168499.1 unnamed protein product [Oppiella nova]